MKYIDSFFCMIILIQKSLEEFEEWYIGKKRFISWIYILSVVLAIVLISCKQVFLGEIIFVLGLVVAGIEGIVGWKYSVRRWLKICILYNLFFSTILACIIQGAIKYTILTPLFIVVYLFVWMFLSLISNSKVSLLVNEIISGITTTIFTIGTYLVSMVLKNMPSSNDYLLYFHTDEAFELALENKDALAWKFVGILGLEQLEIAFLSLLPVIGVTALCIIMIKIKGYWLEKNKIVEPENSLYKNEDRSR